MERLKLLYTGISKDPGSTDKIVSTVIRFRFCKSGTGFTDWTHDQLEAFRRTSISHPL